MTEHDPCTNAHGYAWAFTNEHAPAYALEWLEDQDEWNDLERVRDLDLTATDWAHETADGLAAVIYTNQATALYAAGILDNEDDDLAIGALRDLTESPVTRIDKAIVALSYTWHRRILDEAASQAIEDRADHLENVAEPVGNVFGQSGSLA